MTTMTETERQEALLEIIRNAELQMSQLMGQRMIIDAYHAANEKNPISYLSPFEIIMVAARVWGFDHNTLALKGKPQAAVYCRWHAWEFMRLHLPHVNLKTKGRLLGRDHSTVIHARENHECEMKMNKRYANLYNTINDILTTQGRMKMEEQETEKNTN